MSEKAARYCESCRADHGLLYVCDSYDALIREEIRRQQEAYTHYLKSDAVVEVHGVAGAEILRAMAGIWPDDETFPSERRGSP